MEKSLKVVAVSTVKKNKKNKAWFYSASPSAYVHRLYGGWYPVGRCGAASLGKW